MRRGSGVRIAFVLALVAIAGVLLYYTPMNLGLDLRGGVHVVLEAQDTQGPVTEEAIRGAIAVMERRINALGVAEPIIQRQGTKRIIVELPGVHDQQQAIDTVGATALLEFKDPLGNTVLTGASLKQAALGSDQFGRPSVDIEFDREGSQKFAQMTTIYQGQMSRIMLDGVVLQEVMIREPILEGKGQITGSFSYEEARHLVVLLQEGALPVPMEVMEIRNVGPTLGQDAIDRSFRAGVIGIILVLLFMIFMYKLPGGVADIALAIYVVLLLGALSAVHAVLTLPGIVGFILSIGMAVDANVIIFERIKEELGSGKRIRAAIQAGFDRAFRTILDANITTLITAGVLFYFGTGPVRGFAVTLSLGILVSMFTAIVVTKMLLNAVVDSNPDKMAQFFGVRGLSK